MKVSKIRERLKGFGNKDTIICNIMRAKILTQLKRYPETEELIERVADYAEICLSEEPNTLLFLQKVMQMICVNEVK